MWKPSRNYLEAAHQAKLSPTAIIENLRVAVTGIDVHPVAVHLARAAWTLAAQPAIMAATNVGYDSPISVPVYLGDALQLRFRTGDLFSEQCGHGSRLRMSKTLLWFFP